MVTADSSTNIGDGVGTNQGFPEKGSGHETLLNAANIDQNMYLSVVFYSTQCITTIYVELIFRQW